MHRLPSPHVLNRRARVMPSGKDRLPCVCRSLQWASRIVGLPGCIQCGLRNAPASMYLTGYLSPGLMHTSPWVSRSAPHCRTERLPRWNCGAGNGTHNPVARVCVARDSVHPSPPPVTIPIPVPLPPLTPPDQGQGLGLLPCTQPSIRSPYPNLTQHLTQCKTSPHAHDPALHHPILTRPSPNVPQILTLPSRLQHTPPTPESNACHHLLPPSPPKTTTSTIRDRTQTATHRHRIVVNDTQS